DLGEFFSHLRDDPPHSCSCLLRCSCLLLNGHLAFEARLLDDGDEDVFQREAVFARAEYAEAVLFQPLCGLPDGDLRRVFGDEVKTLAEERDAPAFAVSLEQVNGALRLIDEELD